MLMVYVNVGCLAFKTRTQGAAQKTTRGVFSEEPTANFRMVLEWAQSKNADGTRVYALMGLSSTKIRPARLTLVRLLLHKHGYRTRASQTHASGTGRQRAGVLTAWDPKQLKALPLAGGQLHRTIVQGRHMIMRFDEAGARSPQRGHLLDFGLRYMHVRGSHAGATRDEVNRAWERANHADLQVHSLHGRLITGGDWNAEPAEARDPAARAYSNDIALQDFEAGSGMVRLGKLEPTYVHEKGTSVIDHVYVSPAVLDAVVSFKVVDGVERGGKRHKALVIEYTVVAAPAPGEVERRAETEPVCGGGQVALAACKQLYAAHLSGRLQSVLVRARRRAGLPELPEPPEAWPETGDWLGSANARRRAPLSSDGRLHELNGGLSDAQAVRSIQEATVEAMRLAVAGVKVESGQLEQLAAKLAAVPGRARDQRTPDVRLRAAEVALRARLSVVEAPLVTEREFNVYLPAGRQLEGGTPKAYKGFALGSIVRQEVRAAYGAAVETSFQRAYSEAGLGSQRTEVDGPEARSPELSVEWRRATAGSLRRPGPRDVAGARRAEQIGPAERRLRRLLGGSPSTPIATLWRRAALRLHPDKGGDGLEFVATQEAYAEAAAEQEQHTTGAPPHPAEQHGGLLLWRVRLARYRRRAEREAITRALEHISAQQIQLGSQREGDYWKAQLHRAAQQEGAGAFMTAVYALAASLISGVFGKAGSGKGGAASITAVHEDDDPSKPLITDPRRVVKAVAEFSERMNEPKTSNVPVTMDLMRAAGWDVAGDGAAPQGQENARRLRPGRVSIGLVSGAAPRAGDEIIDRTSACGNMFRMGGSGREERFRDTVCRLFAVACLDPLADVQRMAREAGVPVDVGLVGPRALERRIAAITRLADTARGGGDVRLLCHCCDEERPQLRKRCHGEHYRGLIERLALMTKAEAADVLHGRREAPRTAPGATPGATPAEAARWQTAVDVLTEDAFDQALGRMRVRQAVGADGWRGVLLRWSTGWARVAYLKALRGMMATWGGWPDEWHDWLVTMIEKKGKDSRVFGNLRDIWQSCHGWKIFTGMTRLQYQAIGDVAMPNFASGFRQRRNAMEAVLTTVLAGEQAAAVCAPIARAYVDLSGFFMGVSRKVAFALENGVGMPPSVSECMYSFASGLNGRVDTGALGLTPRFAVAQGLGQGCSNAPDRAMIDLLPAQLTAARLVPGFGFVSRASNGGGSGGRHRTVAKHGAMLPAVGSSRHRGVECALHHLRRVPLPVHR